MLGGPQLSHLLKTEKSRADLKYTDSKGQQCSSLHNFSFAIGNLKLIANPPFMQDLKPGRRAETHPLWPLIHGTVNKAQGLCGQVWAAQGIHGKAGKLSCQLKHVELCAGSNPTEKLRINNIARIHLLQWFLVLFQLGTNTHSFQVHNQLLTPSPEETLKLGNSGPITRLYDSSPLLSFSIILPLKYILQANTFTILLYDWVFSLQGQ